MGLDNLPYFYPCQEKATAVMQVDRIDCAATQACGGCPWKEANPPEKGHVLGMFGTDCWYRGKAGNFLFEKYGTYDEPSGRSFYGSSEDGTYKNPKECIDFSEYLTSLIVENPTMPEEDREGLEYAAWYMAWAGSTCGGLSCWY